MSNLIIIAVGLVFALFGYRKTWYPSWAFLFNVLISVYVSIMITPQVVDRFAVIRNYLGGYSYAGFALAAAAVILFIMDLLSFRYFTAASNASFPKILNSAGAAALGFLAGAVMAGFLLYLITITPLSRFSVVRTFTQTKQTSGCANCAVIAACNVVHEISLQPIPDAIAKQLEGLMNGWNKPAEKVEDINNLIPDSNSVKTMLKPVIGEQDKKLNQQATELKETIEIKNTNITPDSNLR